VLAGLLRRSVEAALSHDALTMAQATAYSAIVALFPALIVSAAALSLLPDTLAIRFQLAQFFDRVLPSNVSPLLEAYFSGAHHTPHTARALVGAALVSVSGASSVMSTLMVGFRRAYQLPLPRGSYWRGQIRALSLVPLSLLPMSAASALVVFGHILTRWLAMEMMPAMRLPFYVVALLLRWGIALAGSVGIIAVIYHLGTDLSKPMWEHLDPLVREPWLMWRGDWSWRSSLPGATVATLLWFVTTLGFGFYVTRFANYSVVYGSVGAAIALMFWLYIIALSVLVGAEFNAQLAMSRHTGRMAD
jgi:membrane protein